MLVCLKRSKKVKDIQKAYSLVFDDQLGLNPKKIRNLEFKASKIHFTDFFNISNSDE